jgi:hypothetical protein
MNVSELLDSLTQQGVQLRAENDRLRIHSPKGILTQEIRTVLAEHKTEILSFLRESDDTNCSKTGSSQDLSLQTIGRLIGGWCDRLLPNFKAPVIDPQAMAKQLKITFKPLPDGYKEVAICSFRETLKQQLQSNGVQIVSWKQATKEFSYEVKIPFTPWKKTIATRVVKSNISAVVDVERYPSWRGKIKIWVAEKLYQFYSHFVWKQKISASKITQFIGWAEENIRPLEDPTNTQVIVLTRLDQEFTNPQLSLPAKNSDRR